MCNSGSGNLSKDIYKNMKYTAPYSVNICMGDKSIFTYNALQQSSLIH